MKAPASSIKWCVTVYMIEIISLSPSYFDDKGVWIVEERVTKEIYSNIGVGESHQVKEPTEPELRMFCTWPFDWHGLV
jgi:hypothetical protein